MADFFGSSKFTFSKCDCLLICYKFLSNFLMFFVSLRPPPHLHHSHRLPDHSS